MIEIDLALRAASKFEAMRSDRIIALVDSEATPRVAFYPEAWIDWYFESTYEKGVWFIVAEDDQGHRVDLKVTANSDEIILRNVFLTAWKKAARSSEAAS